MINVYSLEEEWKDIIQKILEEKILQTKKNKLKYKILSAIWQFMNFQQIDWFRTKNLGWAINEFRISVPGSKNLIRIMFYYEKQELVLLTGYLIKPENYSKSQEKKEINNLYENQIKKSKQIINDFKTERKNSYLDITDMIYIN